MASGRRLDALRHRRARAGDASSKLEFERAAHLRDQIATLKNDTPVMPPQKKVKYPWKKKSKRSR
ncbi:MAG: UvrB/UvrC motif-containing protein [Luteolibacter sp.]